jgi:signal peptidase I
LADLRRIVFGPDPRRTTVRILVLAAFSAVTFRWVLIPIRTEGVSMLPTYPTSGRLNLVNRFAYAVGSPTRGDIVAIRLAGSHVVYVKRIVGLPGERVAIVDGLARIDGVFLAEPYVQRRKRWDVPEVQLGPNEYFVIGDNRGMSDFGSVEGDRILGRVVF